MARRLSHREIIEKLGDMTAVATALKLPKRNTVAHWKREDRGIPPVYWPALVRLAQERGLPVTIADLEAGSAHPHLPQRPCAA
jgi:hypothetical protein